MDTKRDTKPKGIQESWFNEKSRRFVSVFSNLIEQPAFIIALVPAIIYFITFLYYYRFCNRLSTPLSNLFQVFYLNGLLILSVIIIYSLLVYLYLVYVERHRSRYPLILLIILLAIILIYSIINSIQVIYVILILYSLLVPMLIANYLRESGQVYERFWKYFSVIAVIFCILVIIYYLPRMGEMDAENLIKGANGSLEIKMELKDPASFLENKTLILIMYADGKYFVTEKIESINEKSKLYIIPDSQVKTAIIEKIGDNDQWI